MPVSSQSSSSPPNHPAAVSGGSRDPEDVAFQKMVRKWSRLVFSTALHRLDGDAASAQEVTQNVFLAAFRKFEILTKADSPAPWLHRAAMLESSNFLRAERCRRRHLAAFTEAESIAAGPTGTSPEPVADSLRTHLDEALNGLRDPDRELVLGRFFEGLSFAELAGRRSSTPDAVRVKLNRILEKMASLLKRRGVAVTAVGLGTALTTQWSHAAAMGTGAAVAAALHSGHAAAVSQTLLTAVAASRLPVLLTVMTSGKTLGVISLALLLALLALRSQSVRVDELRARISQRAAAAEAARLALANSHSLSSAAGNAAGASSTSSPEEPDNEVEAQITAGSLLAAMRSPQGSSFNLDTGAFQRTSVDEKLKALSAGELVNLLEEVTETSGGAGLKNRTRCHLIAKYLAKKDPAEAMRQAVRYRMSDETFRIVARAWTSNPGAGDFKALLKLVAEPGFLPAGKFGSDPAAAVRRGIASGLAQKDFAEAVALARSAAGSGEAGDYLIGMTYFLGKENRRDTVFELLKGVPEPEKQITVLASMAVALATMRQSYPIATWFDDPAFPPELRNQAVLKAANGMMGDTDSGYRDDDKPLRMIAEGSAPGDRLRNTLEWLRANQPPGAGFRTDDENEMQGDDVVEAALRLAATEDPALAGRWLYSIKNPKRRESIAESLEIKKP